MVSRSLVLLAVLLVGVCDGLTKERFRQALGAKKVKMPSAFRPGAQLLDGNQTHNGTGENGDDMFDWTIECPGAFAIFQHMNASGCLDDGTPLGDNFTYESAAQIIVPEFCRSCNATEILDMVLALNASCFMDSVFLRELSMVVPLFAAMCTENDYGELCVAEFFLEMWLDDNDDEFEMVTDTNGGHGDHGDDGSPQECMDDPYGLVAKFSDANCSDVIPGNETEWSCFYFDPNFNASIAELCPWSCGMCPECMDDPYGLVAEFSDANCSDVIPGNETEWSCSYFDPNFNASIAELCPWSCGVCPDAKQGGPAPSPGPTPMTNDGLPTPSPGPTPMTNDGGPAPSPNPSPMTNEPPEEEMYWWQGLCAAEQCPWEERMLSHQFDCNADLFVLTTLCVRDQDRMCVDPVINFLESGNGNRMPTQYDHERFCTDPCAGAVIEDMYENGMHMPECMRQDDIPIDLSLACFQNNGTFCFPKLYGDMGVPVHSQMNCSFGDPADAANWGTCDSACTASVIDMYAEYGCCTDVFMEVEFGYTNVGTVYGWIESECGVSPPPGDDCSVQFEPPRDTPQCVELRDNDVGVLDALKCLVHLHEGF